MRYRRFRNRVWGGIAALLLSAIAPPGYASDQIIEIQAGSASIQRQGERRRRPAPVGTVIRTGDLVYPAQRNNGEGAVSEWRVWNPHSLVWLSRCLPR